MTDSFKAMAGRRAKLLGIRPFEIGLIGSLHLGLHPSGATRHKWVDDSVHDASVGCDHRFGVA